MPREDREDRPTVVVDPDEEFRHIATDQRPTSPLRVEEVMQASAQWPFAVACLERIGQWAPYAFRRGVVALLEDVTEDMKKEDASFELVTQARELVEALAHMTWAQEKQELHEQSFESTPTTRQENRDRSALREQESGKGVERDPRRAQPQEMETSRRTDGASHRPHVEQSIAAKQRAR